VGTRAADYRRYRRRGKYVYTKDAGTIIPPLARNRFKGTSPLPKLTGQQTVLEHHRAL